MKDDFEEREAAAIITEEEIIEALKRQLKIFKMEQRSEEAPADGLLILEGNEEKIILNKINFDQVIEETVQNFRQGGREITGRDTRHVLQEWLKESSYTAEFIYLDENSQEQKKEINMANFDNEIDSNFREAAAAERKRESREPAETEEPEQPEARRRKLR